MVKYNLTTIKLYLTTAIHCATSLFNNEISLSLYKTDKNTFGEMHENKIFEHLYMFNVNGFVMGCR